LAPTQPRQRQLKTSLQLEGLRRKCVGLLALARQLLNARLHKLLTQSSATAFVERNS
jgi:hypothetical protein